METNSKDTHSPPERKSQNADGLPAREFILKYLPYTSWLILCVLIGLMVAYIRIRYSTPIYHTQSSLLINQDGMNSGSNSKDSRFQDLFMSQGVSNIKNEVQILKSTSVMRRVIRALRLEEQYFVVGKVRTTQNYPDMPFTVHFLDVADSIGTLSLKVNVVDSTKFSLDRLKTDIRFGSPFQYEGHRLMLTRDSSNSNLKNYPVTEFLFVRQPIDQVVSATLGSLSVLEPAVETTILTLSYNGENTSLGENILNTLMKVYDSLNIEDKNRISSNTLNFIDAQLKALHGQLGDVESRTQRFMVTNDVFDITSQSKTYNDNLAEISKKDEDLRVRIAVLDMLSNYLKSSKSKGTIPVPANLGIEEPALAQSVMEYNRLQLQREVNLQTTTAENPLILQMNTSLEKLRSDIMQVLSNVRQSYEIASKSLEKVSHENQGRLKSMPGKSMQLVNIERQQKILEDLYSFLLMKKLETSISAAATISNSRVVEYAASSTVPISPNTKSIYLFNVMIALLIPIGIIALKEVLQDKVGGREDVEKRTDAPILGEISHSEEKETLVVIQNSRRFISEQFRTIRSNMKYFTMRQDRPVIMVTSSFSGEGKSFISTNIGAVMALSGKKTVIMEFDIRKPKIVAGLDLKRKHGITNYIIGNIDFNDLLLPVKEVDNLYVIPCGPIPPNPAELLLHDKLAQLMDEVRKHFDVVILDTAPVGLVGDAYALAKFADITLFIVRQHYTLRNQIHAIEEIYRDKRLPSVTVLLNDVRLGRGYFSGGYYGRYGYYGGYGYGADSGYFEKEEKHEKSLWNRIIANIKRYFS
jgi:tyrosine-protein kinase Etk/Wzc